MIHTARGESQSARIEWSVSKRRCAFCGADLRNARIVGTGSFADGLFCSLDCYANFRAKDIADGLQRNPVIRESS
jgi:hypothetical protein